MAEDEGFDIEFVKVKFDECRSGEDLKQILIEKYLEGFQEIERFFCMMGILFGFIGKDIIEKSRILREHMQQKPETFQTVQSMVEYEVANNLTQSKTKSGLPSGSRTFLRLHRSLVFFAKFLRKIAEQKDGNAKCSVLATEIYGETLGLYHPWLIRQAAYLAMRSLPVKDVFIDTYIKQDLTQAEQLSPALVESMLDVYNIVQSLYEKHDLLQLP